jgi:hypothetical protein
VTGTGATHGDVAYAVRARVARGRGAAFAGVAFPFADARAGALAAEGAAAPAVRGRIMLGLRRGGLSSGES